MRGAVTAGVIAALALSVAAGFPPAGVGPGTGALPSTPVASQTDTRMAVRAHPAAVRARGLPGGTKAVGFAGYVLNVPASWPVYRLAADPQRCVRFDVHAVYLGQPGAGQQCPAHAVGHTDALWLEAAGPAVPARDGGPKVAGNGAVADGPVTATMRNDAAAGEVRASPPGLLVTATYGSDPAAVEQITRSLHQAPGTARTAAAGALAKTAHATASTSARRAPEHRSSSHPSRSRSHGSRSRGNGGPARRHNARTWRHGTWAERTRAEQTPSRAATAADFPAGPVEGIDTCTTPSTAALQAWHGRASAVAAYIGGADRACADGNLSASWVTQVRASGWHIIPTYVGLQPSCDRFGGRIDPHDPAGEGQAAADDAVTQAGNLGIGPGAPLYADVEDYDGHNSRCRTGVLAYLDAWTRELHTRGYLSGVYSSGPSGIRDLANTDSISGHPLQEPDSIWVGFWDGQDNVAALPYLPASDWTGPRRVKQYRGPHWERHGKVRLNIDSDCVYGAVY